MNKLTTVTVDIRTIMDESLPKECQSKEDGICRLGIGTCQQCYPNKVSATGYFLSREEMEALLGEVFNSGYDKGYADDDYQCEHDEDTFNSKSKNEYISSILK